MPLATSLETSNYSIVGIPTATNDEWKTVCGHDYRHCSGIWFVLHRRYAELEGAGR